jgi:hypothetical protein
MKRKLQGHQDRWETDSIYVVSFYSRVAQVYRNLKMYVVRLVRSDNKSLEMGGNKCRLTDCIDAVFLFLTDMGLGVGSSRRLSQFENVDCQVVVF